jgi:lipoate-protein ligase A
MFDSLLILSDCVPRDAATNMAIDEALLESANISSVRFYRWKSRALSFGYFGKFADVAAYAPERDLVRRWTGGGIVFHGDDLTYSIVIPASHPAFNHSSRWIYERIHRAVQHALVTTGQAAELATASTFNAQRSTLNSEGFREQAAQRRNLFQAERGSRIRDAGYCFASPVRADVLVNGCKIAGAAQRRTRRGLLYQGSIQGTELGNDMPERFVKELSDMQTDELLSPSILDRARDIAQQKYGSEVWLRKR